MKKWIIGIIVIGLFFVSAYTGMLGTITGRVFGGNLVCEPDWVLAEERPSNDGERLTDDSCKSLCYSEMETTKFKIERNVKSDIIDYDKCYCDVNKC